MAWLSADFNSKALHMPVSVDVLLPQGHGSYRAIYLLHGAGGDRSSWLLKTRIADYMEKSDIAVIMPSGNNSFFVNQKHGKNYMDYISLELPQLCERWFSLSKNRNDRMIAGMSMGGYGAFANALHHPEIFGYAASFSGLLNISQVYDNPQIFDLKRIFGERQDFENSEYDLVRLTQQRVLDTYFLIMCGEQDRRGVMSSYLYEHMKSMNHNVELLMSKGEHDFTYWDFCIKRAMEWFDGHARENIKMGEKNGSNQS